MHAVMHDHSRDYSMNPVQRFRRVALKKLWQIGKEDPRRPIHALKVGISLTLVCLLYLMEPLFEGIGHNAMWAVMTVVVVLEFTAGATLCKGLNRGLGTIGAGSLAFLVEFIATKTGRVFHAIFIGAAVFVIGATATYLRFIPYVKKNYDYGVVIFLLTFNLITVSSYRVHNVLQIANERFYTIAIGCAICLAMTLIFFPNWAGEDLHNSTISKIEGLATSVQACIYEYFHIIDYHREEEIEGRENKKELISKGYKAVLDSKTSDENQAHFAFWEPRFSRRCHRYPWKQYVNLGVSLRSFSYTLVSLHGCLLSEIQAPNSVRTLFRVPCVQVADEVHKVLMQLAESLRSQRRCCPTALSDNLQKALRDLNSAIRSQPRLFLCSNQSQANNMLAMAAAAAAASTTTTAHLASAKTDNSTLRDWRSRKVDDESKDAAAAERKVLRPQLSKIAITSLEFSEALPFAAFAALLVEAVVRLEMVIEEVEKLGKMADFQEYEEQAEVKISVDDHGNGQKKKKKKKKTKRQSEVAATANDVVLL